MRYNPLRVRYTLLELLPVLSGKASVALLSGKASVALLSGKASVTVLVPLAQELFQDQEHSTLKTADRMSASRSSVKYSQ
jgi:hypothetical protein